MRNKQRPHYVKAYQAWVTILFIDPLAIPLIPLLAAWRVPPNAITVAALIAGVAAGVFFAIGDWGCAAGSFLSSHFLDCLDGNVARLRGLTSEFGARLDNFGDFLRKPVCFAGIAFYLYAHQQFLYLALTAVAFASHVIVHRLYGFLGVFHCDLEFPRFHRTVIRRFAPRVLCLYTYFEEFMFLFVVFPLIASVVGLPHGAVWFLWGALVATALTAAKLLILCNHRRKGRYQQVYQDWAGTKGYLDQIHQP